MSTNWMASDGTRTSRKTTPKLGDYKCLPNKGRTLISVKSAGNSSHLARTELLSRSDIGLEL